MSETARTWHAGHMLFALARHFQWFQQKIATEFEIDGLREDLVIISRAGYATVVEVKVTRADWLKDEQKGRWKDERKGGHRRHVARLFYAVPKPVFDKGIPAHVPAHAGILVVCGRASWDKCDSVREERAATRLKADKLPEARLRALEAAYYYRFWRLQMDMLRRRLYAT